MTVVKEMATLTRTATGEPVPPAVERALPRAWDRDPVISWAATAAVTFLAAFLRLWKLDSPKAFLFDETYYAKQSWSLIHHGWVTNYVDNANEQILAGNTGSQLYRDTPEMIVHPEVGKWLIGLSEWLVGMTPFGWRLMPALIGSAMVFVMIRLARRITGSTLLGLVAGLLMTVDGLHFVLSRLALLDIFVAFFALCGVSCLVVDRDWFRARLADAADTAGQLGPGPRLWWRPWLLGSGIFWGLALGTKWSALYAWVAFGVLVLAWCWGARRSFGLRGTGPRLRAAVRDVVPIAGYLVLVPAFVYLLSWTGWLLNAEVYEQNLSNTQYTEYWGDYIETDAEGLGEVTQSLRSLWNYHQAVFGFHTDHLDDATHPYQSNPLGWPILNKPVGVNAENGIAPGEQGCDATGGETCLRQVVLLGTPALWWFGTVALVWSVVSWIGRRDWRYGVVVVGVLVSWLPWLRDDDRPIFSYYSIVFEPFLILGAAMLLGEILGRAPSGSLRRRLGGIAAGSVVVAIVVNFAWFWPVYTNGLLTQTEWLQRIWFRHWI